MGALVSFDFRDKRGDEVDDDTEEGKHKELGNDEESEIPREDGTVRLGSGGLG